MAGSDSYGCGAFLYYKVISDQEGGEGVEYGMYKDFTAVEIGDMVASNQPVGTGK